MAPNKGLVNEPPNPLVPVSTTRVQLGMLLTAQEPDEYNYLMLKWGTVDSPLYMQQRQTVRKFVEECPGSMLRGGIKGLHKGDRKALDWLRNIVIRLIISVVTTIIYIC